MRPIHLLSIGLLSFSACVTGESPQQAAARMANEAAAARTAILAANKQWMAYIAAGHADSLALLYASNARMMGAGTPTSAGRAAIARAYGEMLQFGAWTIQLHTDSVFANGPLVVETGTWTSTFKPGPHAPPMPPTDKGKYMVRWTHENGRWLLADDIYNSDMMPGPPAAPARAAPPAKAKAKRRR
jgi:ketosteroid isomerase-like protein